jgi:hypothetical protein
VTVLVLRTTLYERVVVRKYDFDSYIMLSFYTLSLALNIGS